MATLTKTLLPISGYTNQYYTYQCVVTENSYNVSNNTSNVTITFSIKGPWAPSFYEWEIYYGITVDGSIKKTGSSSPYISTSYVQLLTWTGDISHNSDGSKSINVGVYLYSSGPSNYLPKQYSSSSPLSMGSVSLTTIPRASSFGTISGNTIGSNMTVNITRHSSSFTHQLWYKLGNSAWYDLGAGIGTQKTFTISNDLLSQLPSTTSGTLQLCVRTYNGSTQIGSDVYKNITVYVASSVVPTVGAITLNPVDINNQNILVQGKNKLTISVSGCSAGTGSGIKSYTFSGPGISSTTTSTSVTSGGTISNTGTLTYTVKVTDNRGRTASKTATIACYAWSAPSITLKSAYRVASSTSTTEDDSGTYIRCTYSLAYSSVNSTNDVTVKIYYKKNSASSWFSVTALTDSKNTSGNKTLSSIDAASTYTVYATITDNYSGSSQSSVMTVFGASRVFNVTSDGTGFAIGKMSEKTSSHTNGLFECLFDTQLYNDLNVDGDMTVDGAVKIGGSLTINSKTLLDLLHPVGSIYQSTVSTNPATLFGGTWEQLSGRFLIAANSTYTAGSTGGEASHTLTVDEIPSHAGHLHTNNQGALETGTEGYYLSRSNMATYGTIGRGWVEFSNDEFYPTSRSIGGGKAHNNMPPYLAVYMWKRTK